MNKIVIIICFMTLALFCFGCKGTNDNNVDYVDEIDTPNLIELESWFFASGIPNNILRAKYSEGNAVFEYSVNNGKFWISAEQKYAKTGRMRTGESIYWVIESNVPKDTYIDIVIKSNQKIIGYVVVEVVQDEQNKLNYSANVLKSVLFKKENGVYPSISLNQINKMIEKTKE